MKIFTNGEFSTAFMGVGFPSRIGADEASQFAFEVLIHVPSSNFISIQAEYNINRQPKEGEPGWSDWMVRPMFA